MPIREPAPLREQPRRREVLVIFRLGADPVIDRRIRQVQKAGGIVMGGTIPGGCQAAALLRGRPVSMCSRMRRQKVIYSDTCYLKKSLNCAGD